MTVYVDNMSARFGRMIMSHMIADTTEELLEMADKISLSRKWIQQANTPGEHFDICKSRRAKAVRCGARQVTLKQLASMTIVRRKTGELCDPEAAEAEARAIIRSRMPSCQRCGERIEAHVDSGACGAYQMDPRRELARA